MLCFVVSHRDAQQRDRAERCHRHRADGCQAMSSAVELYGPGDQCGGQIQTCQPAEAAEPFAQVGPRALLESHHGHQRQRGQHEGHECHRQQDDQLGHGRTQAMGDQQRPKALKEEAANRHRRHRGGRAADAARPAFGAAPGADQAFEAHGQHGGCRAQHREHQEDEHIGGADGVFGSRDLHREPGCDHDEQQCDPGLQPVRCCRRHHHRKRGHQRQRTGQGDGQPHPQGCRAVVVKVCRQQTLAPAHGRRGGVSCGQRRVVHDRRLSRAATNKPMSSTVQSP